MLLESSTFTYPFDSARLTSQAIVDCIYDLATSIGVEVPRIQIDAGINTLGGLLRKGNKLAIGIRHVEAVPYGARFAVTLGSAPDHPYCYELGAITAGCAEFAMRASLKINQMKVTQSNLFGANFLVMDYRLIP